MARINLYVIANRTPFVLNVSQCDIIFLMLSSASTTLQLLFERETFDRSRNLNNNIELSYMTKGIDK